MLRGVSDHLFKRDMFKRHLFLSQTVSNFSHYRPFW